MIPNVNMRKQFYTSYFQKTMTLLIIIFKNHSNIFQMNGEKYHLLHLIGSMGCLNKYRRKWNYKNSYNFIERIKFSHINMRTCLVYGQIVIQAVYMIPI